MRVLLFPCCLGLSLLSPLAHAADADGAPDDAPASAAAPTDATKESPHAMVAVDPLGFALFGPTVNAEAAVGPVGLGAGFRWLSPGLLANSLFIEGSDEFAFSYGMALRGHYYFKEPLAGPHVGVALEYLHVRVENEPVGIATISNYLLPMAEGGYRLAIGQFLVGGVLGVGYAARVGDRVEALDDFADPDAFFVRNESSPYATARLDLGVYF